jgi:predicted nicotinamide N-methyase
VQAARDSVAENMLPDDVAGSKLVVERLQWGDKTDIESVLAAKCQKSGGREAPFDLVLGADVVYFPAPLALLLETIEACSGPSTVVERLGSKGIYELGLPTA